MSIGQTEAVSNPSSSVFNRVGENLYRLESSGVYYALLKRAGKQIRKSLKTKDPALAKRRLASLREKVERLSDIKGASRITFVELAYRWLETVSVSMKPSSASRLDICLKGLKPSFEGVTVRNITSRHCDDWITRRGKLISAQSYKHERRTLIAVLNYAIRDGLLLDNPAKEIPTRKIPKPKIVIPTREQFRVLVETIRKADVRAHSGADLVELLGYSGMRLNEAVNLLWEDVDLDRGVFTVTGGEKGTKNYEARTIPLFPAMRNLLERIKTRIAAPPESSARIIPIACAQTAIINACKKAGLPHFLHHSMRHYFCSNAIEAGIDFKVIASWLGHKDGGVLVAKTYGHLRDTHSFEMAKRMTFSAIDEPPTNVVKLNSAQG